MTTANDNYSSLFLTLLFWSSLWFPGDRLARRWVPELMAFGAFARISVGYASLIVAITPISLLGYVMGGSISWLSSALVLLTTWGIIPWIRRENTKPKINTTSIILFSVMVCDTALALRAGSFLEGDAWFHLGRVRMIYDLGFNNFDPQTFPHHFSRVYHSNVLHALLASCAQLVGDQVVVWIYSLPWAHWLIASSFYTLTFAASKSRQSSAVAAITTLLWISPIRFVIYPNMLAMLWVVPLLFAVILVHKDGPHRRTIVRTAALELILVQLHPFFAILGPALVAPYLLFHTLREVRKSDAWYSSTIKVVASFGVAAPFLLFSRFYDRSSHGAHEITSIHKLFPNLWHPSSNPTAKIVEAWNGLRALDAALFKDWRAPHMWVLLCAATAIVAPHLRRARPLGWFTLTAIVFAFVPPVSELILRGLGFEFLLHRCFLTSIIGFLGLAPVITRELLRPKPTRIIWAGSLMILAYMISPNWVMHEGFADYLERSRTYEDAVDVQRTGNTSSFLAETVPSNAYVFCNPIHAKMWSALHAIYTLGNRGESPWVPGWFERMYDQSVIMNPRVRSVRRGELLQKYGIRWALAKPRDVGYFRRLFRPWIVGQERRGNAVVFRLDLHGYHRASPNVTASAEPAL